jgi:hypothetical protein
MELTNGRQRLRSSLCAGHLWHPDKLIEKRPVDFAVRVARASSCKRQEVRG